MLRVMEFGSEVVNEFLPYARMKTTDYLIRAAGTECFINSDAIEDVSFLSQFVSEVF